MAKSDEEDNALPPVGEDTGKYLEEAKKGKPRSFLLICKGTKVTYLKVKKKPVKKGELSEARKLGYKGEPYMGVITGQGMDLVFNLATADGYESEPVKDKSLKDFLEEHVQLKCKPSFAIVAVAPVIPFDESDLSHPLIARFVKLGEVISAVLDAQPDLTSELQQTASSIQVLLQDENFNDAQPKLVALEQRLSALQNGEPAPKSDQTPTAQNSATAAPVTSTDPAKAEGQPNNENALKDKLQAALNKLVPQLKQLVGSFPERKVELLTPVAKIKQQLESDDLTSARQGLLDVGQLVKSLMSQATGSVSPDAGNPSAQDPQKSEYENKLAALQPKYEQALAEMLGDPNKFRMVMAYATEQGEAGVYSSAIKALDRLAIAIDTAVASKQKETDVIPEGIVNERKKFLLSCWQEALRVAFSEAEKLIEPIAREVPDEDPDEIVDAIIQELQSLTDDINDAILGAQTASQQNLKPFEVALEAVRETRKRIETHPLMELLKRTNADLGVEINVGAQLLAALQQLETRLAS